MLLYQILAYIIQGKIQKSQTKIMNAKYQLRHRNEELELPDGSYSVSDIQDYFEYILEKHGEKTNSSSIRINVNKIENRIT